MSGIQGSDPRILQRTGMHWVRIVDAILLLAALGSSTAFVPASIPCMMRDRRGLVAGTSRHHHHQSACWAASNSDGYDENIIGGGGFVKHAAKVGCSARVLSRMRMGQQGDQSGSAAGKDDDTAEGDGDGSNMPSFYFSRKLDETGGVNRGSCSSCSRTDICTTAFPHRINRKQSVHPGCLVANPPFVPIWISFFPFDFYRLRIPKICMIQPFISLYYLLLGSATALHSLPQSSLGWSVGSLHNQCALPH